jgi:hypothetical protein
MCRRESVCATLRRNAVDGRWDVTTDPLHSLSFVSLPGPSGAFHVPPCICVRDVVWNCGGRTVGRGRSTSGLYVESLPVVVAVAVLVTAASAVVVVAACGGCGGGSDGSG